MGRNDIQDRRAGLVPSLDRAQRSFARFSEANDVDKEDCVEVENLCFGNELCGKRSARFSAGYSLVELLIVVGITIFLSGVILAYNRSSERQIVLYRDQALIIGLLNRAKSLAAQKFNPTGSPTDVPCAFGLHFDETSSDFYLFQDIGSGGCDAPRAVGFDGASSAELIETFSLDRRLEFSNIPAGGFDVMFVAPDLNVSTTLSSGLPITINIRVLGETLEAPITISSAGQIST